ncbi:MAG: alpha/beta fold hydrolase [Rhizobiaceae bacterium]
MPLVKSNGLEIAYEDDGLNDGPAVLMIMGLGVQLTGWPPQMYGALNEAGYRTIRFDNRDIGLSQKLDGQKPPNILLQTILSKIHVTGLAPYNLTDMARDTIGLIDALDLGRVHLVGISMGGMIGQIVAATAPERIRSFTAIMTSTNSRKLPGPRPDLLKHLISRRKPAATIEETVELAVAFWNLIGTKNGGGRQEDLRARVRAAFERCNYPAGLRRQTAAIIETGDLRRWTRAIKSPTLVMHGTADPLVNVAGGKDVAANIEGANLKLVDGWGHDLPEKFLSELTDEMKSHFRSVESESGDSEKPTKTAV